MGRKRKNANNTNTLGIIVLIIILFVYLKSVVLKDVNLFENFDINQFKLPKKEQNYKVAERSVTEDYSLVSEEQKVQELEDKYVEVFFTKTTSTGRVYTAVSRKKLLDDMTDVEFAVKMLLRGPTKVDVKNGIYSEIPSDARLIYVKDYPTKVVVNLSSEFEFGGGGDSLYTRMYQLIKTVNKNTNKPVYLYIDGKQVNMIGGEGLMLRQPLRSNSLDD